jgi:hypothetical protein
MAKKLMSLKDAEAKGVKVVRRPIWANTLDQLHIGPGIWLHLYAPFNQECNGRDPVEILKFQEDQTAPMWEPYTGPLPDSDEYKADVAKYAGCLSSAADRRDDR